MNKSGKSLLGKLPLVDFINQSIFELKKVTWPTRKQVIRLTGIVIVASAATAAYLGALDYLFTSTLSFLLNR